MKRLLLIFLFGILILVSQSCKDQSEKIDYIKYGSQFGMCEGYCYSETIYKKGKGTNIRKAWRDTTINSTKINTFDLSDKNWELLSNSIELYEFYNLDEVIGCPDCTDGGESWIEIKTKSKIHRVSYEYGDPPNELEKLIEEIEKFNTTKNKSY